MKRTKVVTMALTLLALVVLSGCKEEAIKAEAIRPVRVFEIADSAINATRTFPGKVKATRDASLAFRISGQIVRLDVKEGDYVEKGQLIAMLDQRDYQAAVADLRAKLAGARSVLKEASLNIERNRQLLAQSIIAQSAFDTAQSNFVTSRSQVLSMEQSLHRAELNLQHTRLEAPFSGYIAKKIPSNHEYIQAKEPIVELADTSALDVVIAVPESVWIGAFQTKTIDLSTIKARFETLPGILLPVRVKEYQTNANPETQTYKVTMTIDNPAGLGIQPGMTAEIVGSISQDKTKTTVTIPFSSVTGEAGGDKYVWVLDKENTVTRRGVEVGRIINDMFRVESGLAAGEVIVTAGVNYLREGQRVTILEGRIGSRE